MGCNGLPQRAQTALIGPNCRPVPNQGYETPWTHLLERHCWLAGSRLGDSDANEAVAVGIIGVAKAKEKLFGLIDQAEQILVPFGGRADVLKAAARFVAEQRA